MTAVSIHRPFALSSLVHNLKTTLHRLQTGQNGSPILAVQHCEQLEEPRTVRCQHCTLTNEMGRAVKRPAKPEIFWLGGNCFAQFF